MTKAGNYCSQDAEDLNSAFRFHAKREDYTTENYWKISDFNYFTSQM